MAYITWIYIFYDLSHIFRKLLLSNLSSQKWKSEHLTPLSPTLLSCVSKTYTSILNKRISNYLESSSILTEEQSGFGKNRYCLNNLFSLTTIIRNENAEGGSVFSAFLDTKKAFDWIDRDLLNYKLSSVGINGKCIMVLNGYIKTPHLV